MKANAEEGVSKAQLRVLTLTALGVVFGDIGTSPLYTVSTIMGTDGLSASNRYDVLGMLSLIFYALLISVTFKYVWTMLRANNKGEGGIMALMALTLRHSPDRKRKQVLLMLGIFGGALFYGDSVITPAISVVSAIEGLKKISPSFESLVVPCSIGIMAGLFFIQKSGTAKVGTLFGPVMVFWFLIVGVLGIIQIVQNPSVLIALSPYYAAYFCINHGVVAFYTMGAVVLAITGGEALYSDMGHFGIKPIRRAWFYIVFPALLMNYFGQGALILANPKAIDNSFFNLVPTTPWLVFPLVALATIATVIASQAVISGAFSLTRQAVQLGYWPRLHINHTSEEEEGQIYIPVINWLLCGCVMLAILGFRTSDNMAWAYGVAVTGNMIITTLLGYEISRQLWKWPWAKSAALFGLFLIVDIAFFSSNVRKIVDGGWFPLTLALFLLLLMITWFRGRQYMLQSQQKASMPMPTFLKSVPFMNEARVQGTAVFLCGSFQTVPHALMHNLYHNKVLHKTVLLVKIDTRDEPHVPRSQRLQIEDLGEGIFGVTACFGYMDRPNLVACLRSLDDKVIPFRLMETSFFVTHQTVVPRPDGNLLMRMRMKLFALMIRNAPSPSTFFRLPSNRVIEVGSQVEI